MKKSTTVIRKSTLAKQRERLFEQTNAAYVAMRADPEAWAAEQAERKLWDVTLQDGLKRADPEAWARYEAAEARRSEGAAGDHRKNRRALRELAYSLGLLHLPEITVEYEVVLKSDLALLRQRLRVAESGGFFVTLEQQAKIDAWSKDQDKIVAKRQKQKYPNYGAIGGALTYEFTPTSIGVALRVRHCMTKAELDVSDYEDW
jgi:hypothetical protein